MKNALLFFSAFCRTAFDIVRNGGFPPYSRTSGPYRETERFYVLAPALNTEVGVTRRCVTIESLWETTSYYYGRDTRGRMRYPRALLRRLGRIL
jgi:hypothetical protein